MREILDTIIQSMRNRPNPALFLEGKRLDRPGQDEYSLLREKERGAIIAIDGGSAPIVHTPHTCVTFARIISLHMTRDMKKQIKKREGFLVATTQGQETQGQDTLRTKVVFHPLTGGAQELFTLNTEEIKTEESPVLAANGIGRRLLEWNLLKEIERDCSALVLWDGSFTAHTVPEAQSLREIKCSALGLSKTTTCTADHKTFFSAQPEGCWKVMVKQEPKVVFAHLHGKASHLFRFDVLGDADERIDELVSWSKDPVFLGYPYPLVLADQLARVSNEERGALRTRFQATAGKAWKDIAEEETTINAHEILDKMQF